jgi:WD40 repeat protein
LPAQVVRILGDLRFSIDGPVLALAAGPDGSAWSVEEPGVLRRWDVESGQQLAQQHLSDLELVWAFAADAKLLASAGDDLSLWEPATGRLLITVPQPSWVTALSFHPTEPLLATGHDDGVVRLWNLDAGVLTAELAEHGEAVSALAFSADGGRLASAAEDRTCFLWDPDAGRVVGRLEGHTDHIHQIGWHPGGSHLATACWDTTARVWNTQTCEPVFLLNGQAEVVSAVAFSPDGRLLATGDSQGVIWVWEPLQGKVVHKLRGHAGQVNALLFRRGGRQLLSGGDDRRLHLWDLAASQPSQPPAGGTSCASPRLALSPDGRWLAQATGGPAVQLWDTAAGTKARSLEHPAGVCAMSFSPDGRWLAAGEVTGTIRLWSAADGQPGPVLDWHKEGITALSFSEDARSLASAGGTDGYVYIWSLETGEPTLLITEATDNCTAETVAFAAAGQTVAVGGVDWLSTGGSDGAVCVWDVGQRSKVAGFAGGTTRLAIRPDGRHLAVATLSDSVCLYDLQSRTLITELTDHHGFVNALAYDKSGALLATGSEDGFVRLWHAESGEPFAELDLGSPIKDLTFSPDGRVLYTAQANGTTFVVDLTDHWP